MLFKSRGMTVGAYFLDFFIVAVLIVGITATVGVLTNGTGILLFGRKNKNRFVDQSEKMQTNWQLVGGKK